MRDSIANKRATIYMARNRITDDFYIGVTCNNLKSRKDHHLYFARKNKGNHLHNAIRKYGEENFTWIKLCELPSYQDGLDMEVELIKELKPRYNATSGGEGRVGVKHSNEVREANRQRNLNNPQRYWLGKKRDPETVKKVADKKRGSIAWNRKKVICINDGNVFPSGRHASMFYNISYGNLSEVCRGKRKRAGGKIFKYVEE